MLVDQITAFTAATFGHQHASTSNTGRVELPHLDVLNRHAGTQGHAHAVTGIDQGIGGRSIDTTSTTGGKNGSFRTDVDSFASLDADGDDTHDSAVLVFHQIDRVPLVEENGVVLQVALIESMQQRVTGTVSCSARPRSLATLAEVLGLPTERTTDRCDPARYGRTAAPCARARTRPPDLQNTCTR